MENTTLNNTEFSQLALARTRILLKNVSPFIGIVFAIVLTYLSPHPIITLICVPLPMIFGIRIQAYSVKIGRFLGWHISVINGLIIFATCLFAGVNEPTFLLGYNYLLFITITFRGVAQYVNYLMCYGFIIAGSLLASVDHTILIDGFVYMSLYLVVLNRALHHIIVLGDDISVAKNELSVEKDKSEKLLLNILPLSIAERLKKDTSILADGFESVTVLFADIVGFTQISQDLPPIEVVGFLNDMFSKFDRLAEDHGLEKIKTIGDAYMMAGGLPVVTDNHIMDVCDVALKMREIVKDVKMPNGAPLQIRIGISTGSVTAGVIGVKKFLYDLWGDTVNTASRMESHSDPGMIHITQEVYKAVKHEFICIARDPLHIKGKGIMSTYFLIEKTIKINASPVEALLAEV